MATAEMEKRKLFEDIRDDRVPETKEGVVLWNRKSGAPPIKAKFRRDHDVYVRAFYPGEGKYKNKGVGGFLFSHSPDGPIVGRVGTGLSDAQRAGTCTSRRASTWGRGGEGTRARRLPGEGSAVPGCRAPGVHGVAPRSKTSLRAVGEALVVFSPLARLLADE